MPGWWQRGRPRHPLRTSPPKAWADVYDSRSWIGQTGLGQQFLEHLSVADDVDRTATRSDQALLAVDAQLVVNGHGQIFHAQWIILGLRGGWIGTAVDEALLDATARKDDGEDLGPVVATGGRIDLRRTAEFAGNHNQGRIEEAPRVEVADESGESLVEHRELARHATLDGAVHVPATIGERDKANARGNQTTGHQHALTGFVATVLVANRFRFRLDVEGFTGLIGADQAVSAIVEGVHGHDAIGLFTLGEVVVDRSQHGFAGGEALGIDAAWQRQVLDGEARIGRIATQAKRRVGAGEVTRSREVGRHRGDANIGREVFAGSKFVADDRTKARIDQRRAGTIAGEHIVGATLVGGFAVSHRAANGDLVGDLRGLGEVFAKEHAIDLGADRANLAPIFDGSQRLGVEAVLMGHATGKEDVNDRLGFAFLGGAATNRVDRLGLHPKHFIKAKTQQSAISHLKEAASACGIKGIHQQSLHQKGISEFVGDQLTTLLVGNQGGTVPESQNRTPIRLRETMPPCQCSGKSSETGEWNGMRRLFVHFAHFVQSSHFNI